jgi:hypothetical protein
MSSSSVDEVVIDEVTQKIREQQIVIIFDSARRQDGPQIGVVVLHVLGFGVMTFVRMNPDEAQVGDVVIEIVHNGFYTHVQGWLKLRNGARGWGSTSKL